MSTPIVAHPSHAPQQRTPVPISPFEHRQPLQAGTGPKVLAQLHTLGIPAAKCTRHRDDFGEEYSLEFRAPNMADGVAPARAWQSLLVCTIANARITHTRNTVAHWRDGSPVIEATIMFEITGAAS